jgi:hypothetical protein
MASPTLRWIAADGGNREYALRPGVNTIGRYETNSLVIDHPSVSGCHCEVVWEGRVAMVRDLGSTNGTFIEDQPVQESVLQPGQALRLGLMGLVLQSSAHGSAGTAAQAPAQVPPLARPMAQHPARPVPESPRGFFRSLPGTLAYPLSKNGLFLLVAGTVVFGVVEFLASFSLILSVLCTGYLFAYMQKLISASAQGEPEMPDYPEFSEWWSDIVLPFLLLVWTLLFCFGPGAALYAFGNREDSLLRTAALAMLALGGLYFPMALLVVAVTDNFLALSPAVVIPSIFRVLGHYLVACLILGLLAGLRFASGLLLETMPVPVVPSLVTGLVSLYFLAVEMRILGLLYHTNRERLGWFS